jgi:hypothetical protein
MSLFQDIQNSLNQFGNTLSGVMPGAANSIAQSMVTRYLPPDIRRGISNGVGAIGDLQNGNVIGAISRFLPDVTNGLLSQAQYWGTPTPLFGGISPFEAKQIFDEMQATRFCRKNLFLIEVQSGYGDYSERFNLFCTSLDYAPFTISGEKHKIGAAHADSVNSGDPVELRITTMDDEQGFIKNWFEAHANAAVSKDGTVGVPEQYAIRIAIVHGFITQGSNRGGYESVGWFRPANLELSLARSEQALAEVSMTFAQMDTFQL